MKKFPSILVVLLVLLLVSAAGATLRYVSATGGGQYTSLSGAYAASSAGDTILVGPGIYSEPSTLNQQRRLVWIGAGWDQTIVNFGSYWQLNTVNASQSVIEGMRIESSSHVIYAANNPDSIVVRRCLLRSNGGYVLSFASQNSRLYVEDCLLIQNYQYNELVITPNAACLFRNCVIAFTQSNTSTYSFQNTGGTAGTLELYNKVFVCWSRIFNLAAGAQPVIAVNNLFYDWGASPQWGTYPGSSTFDYNASSGPAAPGTNGLTISTNPFVSYDPAGYYVFGTSDLHLDPTNGAPFIDTGHPSLYDPDGSRSDFGVYGGPKPLIDTGAPNYPWAVFLQLDPNIISVGDSVNATGIGRVGPQY